MKRFTLIFLCMALFVPFAVFAGGSGEMDQATEEKLVIKLASSASETDQRAVAVEAHLGPGISSFAELETYWSSTLFKQGTEIEAVSRGNLEMVLASAQEISQFIPEFSIFATGYVIRDAQHQVDIFNNEVMDSFKQMAEDKLKLKLLSIVYLGRRNLNLRGDQVINTPEDLKNVKLRMPGSESWQFLGKALGANPTPVAFTEVYTALQSGAVDGQDNPIPTTIDKKFYEVTDQVVLTGHLVDFNYLSISVDVWNKLNAEQQQQLLDAANKVSQAVREKQTALEKEQISFLEGEGLKVYAPDVDAFRTHVQEAYLNSDYSTIWPAGVLDKINAIK